MSKIDISTYLNRITSEHKIRPKYMALLQARLEILIDIVQCLDSFDVAFDLDKAVGKQLDMIGIYVGISRLLNFQPEYSPALLPDELYRLLIKAKISLNNWDGTIEGIHRIWGDIFPGYALTVLDNQNMTMTVQIEGVKSLFESEIINHGYITPKPMGVRVDYYILFRIELDTELFLGSWVYDKFLSKDMPEQVPADNAKPTGELFVGSFSYDKVLEKVLPVIEPTDNDKPSEHLFIGGKMLYNNKYIYLLDPPSTITATLNEQWFIAGLRPMRLLTFDIKAKEMI